LTNNLGAKRLVSFRPGDFESAQKLIDENELLRNDDYTKAVMESEGVGYNGEQIKDIGDFVVERLKHLEKNKEKVTAKKRDVFVENSPNPELEEK
jgi:hypothetical protein